MESGVWIDKISKAGVVKHLSFVELRTAGLLNLCKDNLRIRIENVQVVHCVLRDLDRLSVSGELSGPVWMQGHFADVSFLVRLHDSGVLKRDVMKAYNATVNVVVHVYCKAFADT